MEWPASADQDHCNPILIERFMEKRIKELQVTLLGEVDLDSIQSYGDANWSLRQLANYTFNTPLIRSALAKWTPGNCYHPAIVAVWTVAQAQNLEDGKELWTTSSLEPKARIHLAQAFSESISKLGLETFEGQLEGMQKHMILARLHAVIPNYAIEKFTTHIRRGTSYHRPPKLILSDIVNAQDMSRAVQKLFEEKPELGLDLIDRSVQLVRHGNDAGLPPRLALALSEGLDHSRGSQNSPTIELPVVALDENSGELYVRGATGWTVQGDSKSQVNIERLPCENVLVQKIGFEVFEIMDVSSGYLLFNQDLELSDGRVLPNRGGIILFRESVNFSQSELTTEVIDFFSWPGWKMAHFGHNSKFQIILPNGVIRSVVSRGGLEIDENIAMYLQTKNRHSIFSKMPELLSGQIATSIDQINRQRIEIGPEASPVSTRLFGALDINIYAGLGKSRRIRGLLLPGIELSGDLSPMTKGEERQLKIVRPVGWNGPDSIFVSHNEVGQRASFELSDGQSSTFEIFVDVPKLNWSIEFEGQVPDILDSSAKYRIAQVKKIKRLVIHGLGDQYPRLLVRQGDRQTVLNGRPRNEDCLYDMQVIQDSSHGSDIRLMVNLNGREIELALFISKQPLQAKHRMQRVTDIRELANIAVERGVITESDWVSFEQERLSNSIRLRNAIRERRR
jgi:hypothetical protein